MTAKERRKILLVDDDGDLLDLLKYNFRKEGFEVRTVSKIGKALEEAEKFRPELIVLDVVMPDGNGIDLCRTLRNCAFLKDTYIFILSGRADSVCRESALGMGADDFIEKLSGLRALTNKVIAVLKHRYIIKKSISELSSAGLILDKKGEIVSLAGRRMHLSKPEFEILFFLMQNPDKVVSRNILVRIIWGSEIFASESSVQYYVEKLKHKIGPGYIQILEHEKYRFNSGRRKSQFLS